MVGYRRFEGLTATEALANLYRPMRLFANFFQSSFRLAETKREEALSRKLYHARGRVRQAGVIFRMAV